MNTLEIQVNDTVTIVDGLVQAIEVITRVVEGWLRSANEKPLVIILTKMESRAPPELSISVNDSVSAKGGLA
jgi:hypothetical protein